MDDIAVLKENSPQTISWSSRLYSAIHEYGSVHSSRWNGAPKSCASEVFIDNSKQVQERYTGPLLSGEKAGLLSLYEIKRILGLGQVTCAQQASTDWWPRLSFSGRAEHRNLVKFCFADLGTSHELLLLGPSVVTLTAETGTPFQLQWRNTEKKLIAK